MPYDYLLENTDPELVKMELDLYWIKKGGQDPVEYFKKDPSRFELWHVKDMEEGPEKFFAELNRVTKDVTLVIPPVWDISAALNIFEHRHIFLSCRKEHKTLPVHISLPLAAWIHKKLGQKING